MSLSSHSLLCSIPWWALGGYPADKEKGMSSRLNCGSKGRHLRLAGASSERELRSGFGATQAWVWSATDSILTVLHLRLVICKMEINTTPASLGHCGMKWGGTLHRRGNMAGQGKYSVNEWVFCDGRWCRGQWRGRQRGSFLEAKGKKNINALHQGNRTAVRKLSVP